MRNKIWAPVAFFVAIALFGAEALLHRRAMAAAALVLLSIAATLAYVSTGARASHAGGMDAMSIDADVTGNTATSLGTRENCAVVAPGASVTVDVTAANIPATNPMFAFVFYLDYPSTVMTVDGADPHFLIESAQGSSIADASEPVPDSDGRFSAGVFDFATPGSTESGSGVLMRLTISVSPQASPGQYILTLSEAFHVDPLNEPRLPDALNHAFLAVDASCEDLPPPPTPTPTPTPQPPPTPPVCSAAPPPPPAPTSTPEPGVDAVGIDHNGPPPDINPGPATAPAGGCVTISVIADTPSNGLGAVDLSVNYDPSVVVATSCTAVSGASVSGACNVNFAPGVVRVSVAAFPGLFGSVNLVNITFQAVGSPSQCSSVVPTVDLFADPQGINLPPPAVFNGQICVGTPEPTPTPGPNPDATISIGSATCAPASSCGPVNLIVTPQNSLVGALDIDVNYDPTVLTVTGCTPAAPPPGICNPAFDADTVRFSMSDINGLSGVQGTITFNVVGGDGSQSPLDLVILTCADITGNNINCADQDGTISVSSAPIPDATVSIGSAICAPASTCGPVNLTVTPINALVGALDIDVNYDNNVLAVTACTPAAPPPGICNPAFDADTVRFSMSDLNGLSGVQGTITFNVVGGDGSQSPLDVVILTCADVVGNNIDCADQDGTITVSSGLPNDNFANATSIASLPFTDSLITSGATTELDEPTGTCVPTGATVWYAFTPVQDMTIQADTFGSDFDTVLAAYAGTSLSNLTSVACNDQFNGNQSKILFSASAGTTYYFQAGGFFSQTGGLVFNLAPGPAPPPNDDFANAASIASLPFTDSLNTAGATTEPGEPTSTCGPTGATVWYAFTPDVDMSIAADTSGSNLGTVLAAFTGDDVGNLQPVGCQSFGSLILDLTAGTTYYFQAGGFFGQTGDIVFNMAVFVRLEVGLSIDQTGTVAPTTGVASISGTATCTKPAFVDLNGSLRQRAGRASITGLFSTTLQCDGVTTWSATVTSDSGPFAGGPADVSVNAFASTFDEFASAAASATVRLQGTRTTTTSGACPRTGNDGFEAGVLDSNEIPCWTVTDAGTGSWCTQTGTAPPLGPCAGGIAVVPPPPEGAQAAMTAQSGPGAHLLYRCGTLRSGSIGFQLYLNNQAGIFVTVPTLDPFAGSNQQFRADLVRATALDADPFTVDPADVLMNLYQTEPGDPPQSGYLQVTADASAYVGESVCLRFAEVDNQFYFNVGIDDVALEIRQRR